MRSFCGAFGKLRIQRSRTEKNDPSQARLRANFSLLYSSSRKTEHYCQKQKEHKSNIPNMRFHSLFLSCISKHRDLANLPEEVRSQKFALLSQKPAVVFGSKESSVK